MTVRAASPKGCINGLVVYGGDFTRDEEAASSAETMSDAACPREGVSISFLWRSAG